MALKIAVGPAQLALHEGHSVLLTEKDGQITAPSDKGLYFLDTRLISSWSIYANGQPWELLNSASITHYASRIFLTNRSISSEKGNIPERTIGLAISRTIDGGIHEDLDLVNFGKAAVSFNLEICIRSDFADLFEVKSGKIVRRGRIMTDWSDRASRLRTTYRNKDFCRELAIKVHQAASAPVFANGRLSFEIALAPGETWHACLLYELADGKKRLAAPRTCIADAAQSGVGRRLAEWHQCVPKMHTSNEDFSHLYNQAVDDMAALRYPVDGTRNSQFLLAAGVPWFVALFGRDTLITSLQTAIIHPGFACATLDVLGSLQARERDDYRDAEPGKIMHEMRFGELAHFKLVPHTPYYGTADATILYLIVLHVAWRCTGDDTLLARHMKTAEGCLDWIDRYGDRDGDGFQEYATRSPVGYENQGWKDSGDSVVYPDGSLVKGPKALCELQGYVYDAWQRMAEVYDALGKPDKAETLRAKARALFNRFNDAFWDEDLGFYAYALDGDKKKVLTVASNPGHCLWSGIVPPERADRVMRRLMEPDMWSGWGIRTLSSKNPAYNPYSYQDGSVWPHDNAIIALGFRRYGFADEAQRIASDVCGASSYFLLHQVPELFSGVKRDGINFPVQYLGANVPQAWAAGAAFNFLQMLLGYQPDAPHGKLYIDPKLPDWLPDLTLNQLKLGDQAFDVRLWRDGEDTRWEVLEGDQDAIVQRSFATAEALAPEESTSSAPEYQYARQKPDHLPTLHLAHTTEPEGQCEKTVSGPGPAKIV